MNIRSRACRVGAVGERMAFKELHRRGYNALMIEDFWTPNADLKINHLPVEVKIAYPTYRKPHPDGPWRPRWQFHISPTAAHMVGEWLLILIAVDSSGHSHWYIIPGSVVSGRQHLQITSHPDLYSGWMSYYRGKWEIIDPLCKQDYDHLLEMEGAA